METLRKNRFELFLVSISLLLFGSLLFPEGIFVSYIYPILILLNLLAGFVLISVRKKTRHIYGVILIFSLMFELMQLIHIAGENQNYQVARFVVLSVFYVIVTTEIILQVWKAKEVNKNVIFGVMGGYVSLGLIGFFLLVSIHLAEPAAFRGLEGGQGEAVTEQLLYYAYITLMTIGYGDIVPVNPLAHKAAVLIGLFGQFYLVIITATVVGKYIGNEHRKP